MRTVEAGDPLASLRSPPFLKVLVTYAADGPCFSLFPANTQHPFATRTALDRARLGPTFT